MSLARFAHPFLRWRTMGKRSNADTSVQAKIAFAKAMHARPVSSPLRSDSKIQSPDKKRPRSGDSAETLKGDSTLTLKLGEAGEGEGQSSQQTPSKCQSNICSVNCICGPLWLNCICSRAQFTQVPNPSVLFPEPPLSSMRGQDMDTLPDTPPHKFVFLKFLLVLASLLENKMLDSQP